MVTLKLDALKPDFTENEIEKGKMVFKNGKLELESTRFKTRLRETGSIQVCLLQDILNWP